MAANDASKPILYWVMLVVMLAGLAGVAATAKIDKRNAIDNGALKLNENGPPDEREGHPEK